MIQLSCHLYSKMSRSNTPLLIIRIINTIDTPFRVYYDIFTGLHVRILIQVIKPDQKYVNQTFQQNCGNCIKYNIIHIFNQSFVFLVAVLNKTSKPFNNTNYNQLISKHRFDHFRGNEQFNGLYHIALPSYKITTLSFV